MNQKDFKQYSQKLGFQTGSLKPSIYALCDYELLEKYKISLESYLKICKKNNIKIIQYRDKVNSLDVQKENLIYLRKNCDVPIIINDKIELIDYADGLHIGQEDLDSYVKNNRTLSLKLIRTKVKTKILGLSTHNEVEILEANKLDIDYIGLGAYRATTTKVVENQLGDKLPYLAKISKHPVCAIGGVLIDDIIKNTSFNVIGSGLLTNKRK